MDDMQLKALVQNSRKPYEFRKGDTVRILDGRESVDRAGWSDRAPSIGMICTVRENSSGSPSVALNVHGASHNLFRACWLELVTPAPREEGCDLQSLDIGGGMFE